MKKLVVIITSAFIVSCSKEDATPKPLLPVQSLSMTVNGQTVVDSTDGSGYKMSLGEWVDVTGGVHASRFINYMPSFSFDYSDYPVEVKPGATFDYQADQTTYKGQLYTTNMPGTSGWLHCKVLAVRVVGADTFADIQLSGDYNAKQGPLKFAGMAKNVLISKKK